MYYYDENTKKCVAYLRPINGGFGGQNTYGTKEKCEQACDQGKTGLPGLHLGGVRIMNKDWCTGRGDDTPQKTNGQKHTFDYVYYYFNEKTGKCNNYRHPNNIVPNGLNWYNSKVACTEMCTYVDTLSKPLNGAAAEIRKRNRHSDGLRGMLTRTEIEERYGPARTVNV